MKQSHPVAMTCIIAAVVAHTGESSAARAQRAPTPPIAPELQPLQGTWAGGVERETGKAKDSKAAPPKPDALGVGFLSPGVLARPAESSESVTVTISGNSLHFHRDTNFWFKTTISLPEGTRPRQLHATIKDAPPSQADSIGQVVGAIFKVENETLTLADYALPGDPPKSFDDATSRYILRKVQPPKEAAEPPKAR